MLDLRCPVEVVFSWAPAGGQACLAEDRTDRHTPVVSFWREAEGSVNLVEAGGPYLAVRSRSTRLPLPLATAGPRRHPHRGAG